MWVTDTLAAFTEEEHRAGIDHFKAWYATDPERQLRITDQVIADWEAARAPEPEVVGTGRCIRRPRQPQKGGTPYRLNTERLTLCGRVLAGR